MRAARGLVIGVLIGSMLWVALGLLVMQARAGENGWVRWKKGGYAVTFDTVRVTSKFINRSNQIEFITCRVVLKDEDGKKITAAWSKPKKALPRVWTKRATVFTGKGLHEVYDHWKIRRCLFVEVN